MSDQHPARNAIPAEPPVGEPPKVTFHDGPMAGLTITGVAPVGSTILVTTEAGGVWYLLAPGSRTRADFQGGL